MDLASLALALALPPARLDARAASYAGQLLPVVVPAAMLPSALRAQRLLSETRLPLAERVGAALAWGEDESAWRMLLTLPEPLPEDSALATVLRAWVAREAQRWGVDARAALAALTSEGRPRPTTVEERGALSDVQELLAPLRWPRWHGPLLLAPWGLAHPALAPGRARVVRPALPILRIAERETRASLAVAIAELALALAGEPRAGWPAWLRLGVAGAARARADGTGLAERRLGEIRACAGSVALARLLADEEPLDAQLATAVVGALLHPSRRRAFPVLLAALRAGCAAEEALARAYGLTVRELAGEPPTRR
ncbi:MAG: hypothetical protein RMM29_00355 [Planctomycetota bacterium]|nr:hypothetical protein [Planctomycetota bacterium]MDW8372086.1 hypothetical protein [Planctomycetota bacterium]